VAENQKKEKNTETKKESKTEKQIQVATPESAHLKAGEFLC